MGSKKDRRWETGLRIDEARVMAPETPQVHRARKDRRHWCRGKAGLEHKPVYRISKNNLYWRTRYPDDPRYGVCSWVQRVHWNRRDSRWDPIPDDWYYHCGHESGCSECGKILTNSWRLPKRECPSWKSRAT